MLYVFKGHKAQKRAINFQVHSKREKTNIAKTKLIKIVNLGAPILFSPFLNAFSS